MTPDAAGIVAQVDAGILIALVVDARQPIGKRKDRDEDATNKYAWLHLIGVVAVLTFLVITLASVIYHKPLTGIAPMPYRRAR